MTASIFDSDLFDAEVVLERASIGNSCTAIELGRLLGSDSDNGARNKVQRLLARDRIPAAATKGRADEPARWSRSQVLRIVARNLFMSERDETSPRFLDAGAIK